MIADFLYALSEMEAASAPVLQRYRERFTLSAAAAQVTAVGTPVPRDKFCVVLCVTAEATEGAGETVNGMVVAINDETNTFSTRIAYASLIGTARLTSTFNFVLLAPGERLVCSGEFSPGGPSANQVSCDAIGLYIPKGNLQLR